MKLSFPTLPATWLRTRVDRVASVHARIGWKALTASEYLVEGYAFLATPNIKMNEIDFDNVNFISEFRFLESPELKLQVDDVLLVKDGNTLGITNVVRHLPRPATVNGSIAVVRPTGMDSRFLRYTIASDLVQGLIGAYKAGMGVPHLFQADIKKLPLPQPPLSVQHAIADFLDEETARIDALIDRKRRMIALFDARRREAVSAAALRGSREPRLRPSRSGFLGGVPAGWEETQLRHLDFSVQTGPFGSQLHAVEYVEDGWPVINPANLVGGRIRPDRRVSVTDERRADLRLHVLRRGDILIGRRGEMGRAALVTDAHDGWLCGTGCLRLRPRGSRLDSAYLLVFLQTPAMRAYFSLASVGSTMENLNAEIVLGAPILVPPAHEQLEIIDFAARVEDSHEAVAARLDKQLDLLREHRQALITAAVTGQLQVAAAAA